MWESINEHVEFKSNKVKFLEKLVDSFSPKVEFFKHHLHNNKLLQLWSHFSKRTGWPQKGDFTRHYRSIIKHKTNPASFWYSHGAKCQSMPNQVEIMIDVTPNIISLVSQVIGIDFSGWSLVMDQT